MHSFDKRHDKAYQQPCGHLQGLSGRPSGNGRVKLGSSCIVLHSSLRRYFQAKQSWMQWNQCEMHSQARTGSWMMSDIWA